MAETYFLSVLEAGSPKVKVSTGLISSVASVLGLPPAPCVIPTPTPAAAMVSPFCPCALASLCVQISSSCKDTAQTGWAPTLNVFFLDLNSL